MAATYSYWLLVLQTELATGLYLLCHWGSCCDARAASPGAHIIPLFFRVCIDHYVYAAPLPVDGVCEPACVESNNTNPYNGYSHFS